MYIQQVIYDIHLNRHSAATSVFLITKKKHIIVSQYLELNKEQDLDILIPCTEVPLNPFI